MSSELEPPLSSQHDDINGMPEPRESTQDLTVFTAVVFAVGEMAGSGVLTLPRALASTGWIGVPLHVVCAIASAYTGILLGKCWLMVQARYREYRTNTRYPYPAIGFVTYGKIGRMIVSCSIDLTLFGVSVVYFVLASQNIQQLVRYAGKDISFCIWLLILAAALWPTSLLGTPKDFWPVSIGALISTSVACILIVVKVTTDSGNAQPVSQPHLETKDAFMAFGTLCFAFGGHAVFPTIQVDMKEPKKFGKAVFIAYFILVLMYLPVAIAGYVVYDTSVHDNILLNLSKGPILYVVEVLITMHIFFGFIIVINPVCQEMEALVGVPSSFTYKRIVSRTVFMVLVLFVAETVPQFGVIMSLIGGSTTTLIIFVFPPIFYLKLCHMKGDWEEKKPSTAQKTACGLIIFVGLVAGVASTYSAVDALATSRFSKPCYI
ncbi:hypothetical protein RRG08_034574 [Elysia crispata]|uniref:Amino acid transporter transmembrane domain-containing protein n=1 Tax=Elysia crispata TaxID=231223 RepID=A0AAE1E9N0_9GAST|nr:hypothetical protein RRG08_034574 [Elysia crispata]